MWSIVLLFLGLMKAASYVAGSGTTVNAKSGMSLLRYVMCVARSLCVSVKTQSLRLNERITTRLWPRVIISIVSPSYFPLPLSASGFLLARFTRSCNEAPIPPWILRARDATRNMKLYTYMYYRDKLSQFYVCRSINI